jgi:tetratricopeptide (TPR) repeat protein
MKSDLKKLGRDHIDVAATRNNMGVVFMKKGEHNAAMECFAAALSVREEILGPDHEKCSDTLHNMGLVHKNLKQYNEAIERYDQALRVRKMQLGENDMKVADTLYNMAIVYANTGQYSNALGTLQGGPSDLQRDRHERRSSFCCEHSTMDQVGPKEVE